MGGGNAQKSKTARERNLEKAKAGAKGSQLESNKKAMSIQCKVCMQEFMCTTSEVKCREHAEAKHPKSDVYYGTICACPKSEEPIDPQTLTNGQIGDRFIPASMEKQIYREAQKIFGNRWTEIAKVVSGRTDNAVKNRFSTLCKKRAKYEALAKENSNSCINPNNKRILLQNGFNTDGTTDSAALVKRMRRSHIPDLTESCNFGDRAHRVSGTIINQQLRHPFAVLGQNLHNANNLVQPQVNKVKDVSDDAQSYRTQGTFLKKDDPKITALMQQAELLSSLALKVNTDGTEESLENAWKVLQDFLNQSKENDTFRYTISDIDFQIEDFKDLLEDLRSSNEGSQQSWRQPDLYEVSPSSSEYSTGSTIMPYPAGERGEKTQAKIDELHPDILSNHIGEQNCSTEEETRVLSSANKNHGEMISSSDDQTNIIVASTSSSAEFSSPVQVTPLFRSLAAGIPSPKFSESERNFLLKTLGMESPSPSPANNLSQPPPCKRALLHSL